MYEQVINQSWIYHETSIERLSKVLKVMTFFSQGHWITFLFYFFTILVDVYNVSLSPVDNPLNITENDERLVKCVVNSNADPVPTITWYLGSTNITSKARANTNFINITGNRNDTDKNLQCRATNSNKTPKTASTVLNVQCKYKNTKPCYLLTDLNELITKSNL